MQSRKIGACTLAGMTLCALLLGGCSGDQEKKEEKKTLTVQEQMGRDAAQALQKPLEEARRTAAQMGAKADQALQEVTDGVKKAAQDGGLTPNQNGVKEKKKLEGC